MSDRATAVNPQVLRWARERAGLSLPDVASRLGKTQEAIAEWEKGDTAPTFRQLERLAERLYKRPLAIFFFPHPPDEEDPATQFRTLPASELYALAPDTRYALREALAFQESVRELSGGHNPATRLITRIIRPEAGASAENLAAQVRSYLGISLDTQSSWDSVQDAFKQWRRSIEGSGVLVFKRPFKQADISGFCIHDDNLPLIVINNSIAHSRQIFTIFHELAHLLYSVSGITKQDNAYIEHLAGRSREIEVACNHLAAEILVPSPTFPWNEVRKVDLERFVASQAKRYNVSREVILRRLLDRGFVDQATYTSSTERWNREYQRASKGRSGGNYYAAKATYLGETFLRLAFTQYYRGRISLQQLAGHLHVKARNIPQLEDFVISGE